MVKTLQIVSVVAQRWPGGRSSSLHQGGGSGLAGWAAGLFYGGLVTSWVGYFVGWLIGVLVLLGGLLKWWVGYFVRWLLGGLVTWWVGNLVGW